jgi:hypothetical protein
MFIHHITGGLISQTWRNADDLVGFSSSARASNPATHMVRNAVAFDR